MDATTLHNVCARDAVMTLLCSNDYAAAYAALQQLDPDVVNTRTRFASLSLADTLQVMQHGTVPLGYNFDRDFRCTICARPLCNPVAMLCGHAACRTCAARGAFFREKCRQCDVVIGLPRGYHTDQAMRVLEKQRSAASIATNQRGEHTLALDSVLDLLSTIVDTHVFSLTAPVAVVELRCGMRVQLRLRFMSEFEQAWALNVWFISDCADLSLEQPASTAVIANMRASLTPLLSALCATVSVHQQPQRLVMEALFSPATCRANTLRLSFHAVHSWAYHTAEIMRKSLLSGAVAN